MRIKVSLRKDRKLRSQFRFFELKVRSLKILYNTNCISYLDMLNNVSKLRLQAINLSKIKNKCFLTSRSRGLINENTHLSRIKIKEILNIGVLVGFKKYSW